MEKELIVKNIDETFTLATKITSQLFVGAVVLLRGDLGAGKTTFVKGAAKELEIKELIQSPTFNILKCYFDAKIPMYHIDAYRLEDAFKDIGLEEYIEGDGITFIEWPDFIKEYINVPVLNVSIYNLDETSRRVVISSTSDLYNKVFEVI